jgi:hypothetical protein
MTTMGHNNPPDNLETAKAVAATISEFMSENPIVFSEEEARLYKIQIDRAKLQIKDLEAERDSKVRPLNEKVASINADYRKPNRILGDLLAEALARVQDFVRKEEYRRAKIAEEAARKAREAEEAALEAERLEKERLDDAAHGEVGVDIAEVIEKADDAFEDYQRAEREAIMARKEAKVRVGGGFARALSMREKEILDVVDAIAALTEIGATENIKAAILTSARAFRKIHNRLPKGISATIEKVL